MQLPYPRLIRHVRSLLTDEVAQTLARRIVASRLDYCNALLHGALTATIVKLQRAQNNLARVVCQRGGRTDAASLLRSLHWLPVKHRITFKTAVLTHKMLTTSTPPYLHDMLTVAAPARPMRSAGAPVLFVPRVRTELARRAFSVAEPTVFNSLPADIKNHKLKTRKLVCKSRPEVYINKHFDRRSAARPMRSAVAPLLFVPRVRTELARRAFSVAGPTVFNSLPDNIRLSHSIDTFRLIFLELPSLSAPSASVSKDRRYTNVVFSF